MKTKEVTIKVHEIVGGDSGISTEDGELVFKRIDLALKKGASVVVDFKNIQLLVSAFLNAAIGQIYGKHKEADVQKKIKIQNISADDELVLKKVMTRAKEYFAQKKSNKGSTRTKSKKS